MVENTDCLNPSAALALTGVGRDGGQGQGPASSIQLEEQERLETISAVSHS